MTDATRRGRLSRLATCYEAVVVIYLNAMRAHLRTTLVSRFGAEEADREVRNTLAQRWGRRPALRAPAADEPARVDVFDALDVGDLGMVVDKYIGVEGRRAADRVRAKTEVLHWMAHIALERNTLSHPAARDAEWDRAVTVINVAARVLRSLGLTSAHDAVRKLLTALFVEMSPAPTTEAPTVAHFDALYGAAISAGGYELFLTSLMEFFQRLADEQAEMDREDWIELLPGESLLDYAWRWNTAPENVVFAIQDWLVNGWAGGSNGRRGMGGDTKDPTDG